MANRRPRDGSTYDIFPRPKLKTPDSDPSPLDRFVRRSMHTGRVALVFDVAYLLHDGPAHRKRFLDSVARFYTKARACVAAVQRETLAIQIEALRFRTLPDGSRKRRSAARIASMLHVHKSAIKKILAAHPESAPKQTAPTQRRGRRVSVQFPQ